MFCRWKKNRHFVYFQSANSQDGHVESLSAFIMLRIKASSGHSYLKKLHPVIYKKSDQ